MPQREGCLQNLALNLKLWVYITVVQDESQQLQEYIVLDTTFVISIDYVLQQNEFSLVHISCYNISEPLILLLVSLGEAVILRATYVCVLQCNLCKAGQADVNLVTNPKLNDFHSMLDGRMKRSNATATMTQLVDSIGRQNADTMV